MARGNWDPTDTLTWLIAEGRLIPDVQVMFRALAYRLVDAGAPVDRMRVAVRTIHPLLRGWGITWFRQTDDVQVYDVTHSVEGSSAYIGSPMQTIYEEHRPVRKCLRQMAVNRDHAIFQELRDEGYTDYLGMPMVFQDGTSNALVFTTRDPEGFSDMDIAHLARVTNFLAAVIEIHGQKRTARHLLDTYLGRQTGHRVLNGLIRRGDGLRIQAALWFSDLRNFTYYAETLALEHTIVLLNRYFETVWFAVSANGGEILDFIGDGMLVVFPCETPAATRERCAGALRAAHEAFEAAAFFNAGQPDGAPQIAFGVGLHVGEVIYGNVGAPDRLDFRVIGPAVNRTARLESLTKELGRSLLLSAEFAAQIDDPTVSLGQYSLKGIADPQDVRGLAA